MITDVSNSVGAACVELAVGAFCFDDQRGTIGSHDLAVASRVADVHQHFHVTQHVEVPGRDIDKLHGSSLPGRFHFAERHSGTDHVVFDVAGVDPFSDLTEAGFPVFAFPTMGGIGVDGEAGVVVANFDQVVKFVGAAGSGSWVDLVGEVDTQVVGFFPDLLRLGGETFVSFFNKVVIAACPESPGIAGCNFPAVGDAPEHGENLDPEFGAKIE